MFLAQKLSRLEIYLITFVPNTTHFSQPLDVAFFRPMKQRWAAYAQRWCKDHPNECINKANFPKIFIPFILNHFKHASPNVRNGFKVTGLMPFSPDGVDFSKILVKKRNSLAVPTERVKINDRIKRRERGRV